MKEKIQKWLRLHPDPEIESSFFAQTGGQELFYPFGTPGPAYQISAAEKSKFIGIFSFMFVFVLALTASLLYPFDMLEHISIFGFFVVGLNFFLALRWTVPLIFLKKYKLPHIESKHEYRKMYFFTWSTKILFLQIAFITLGLMINAQNNFLWLAAVCVLALSTLLFLLWLSRRKIFK